MTDRRPPGTLVLITEVLDADGVRPARLARVVADLDDVVLLQPIDVHTGATDGPEEEVGAEDLVDIIPDGEITLEVFPDDEDQP